ncbi:MAG TPA: hypothetical protein VG753_01465 [Candidatus Paceibacterota bacterium]|nr:hypothetical protein [Candidatus Paceibacterota bacterium]
MSTIEERVMGTVGAIYIARSLVSATALRMYALLVSLAGIIAFASVPHVVLNFLTVAHSGPGGVALFVLYAVLGTTIVVQLALAVGATAAVSLLVSFVRTSAARRTALA